MSGAGRRKPTGWIQRLQQSSQPSPADDAAEGQAANQPRPDVEARHLQEMLPAAAVTAAFRIDRRTLTNWEVAGVLVPIRILGRRYYALTDVCILTEIRKK